MKDKTITLRIPAKTFEAVDWIAVTQDRSFNAQVKRILNEYVENYRKEHGDEE